MFYGSDAEKKYSDKKIDKNDSGQISPADSEIRARAKAKVINFTLLCLLFVSAVMVMIGITGNSVINLVLDYGSVSLGLVFIASIFAALVYRDALNSQDSNLISAEKDVFVDVSGVASEDIKASGVVKDKGFGIKDRNPPASDSNAEEIAPQIEMNSSPHLDMPFELYVNAVVKALDNRINLSEMKATLLLKQGKSLMGWGIVFYVFTIIGWQVAAHAWGYSHTLIVGMVSCSLTFIVIEFLAAWFLKQYRSYIDSSMAYLQVRSVFNNYLLTYYAVNQFGVDPENRKILVAMLSKEVKWPSLKELSKNDFNYMVESIAGFTGMIEKLKLSVKPKKTSVENKKVEKKAKKSKEEPGDK